MFKWQEDGWKTKETWVLFELMRPNRYHWLQEATDLLGEMDLTDCIKTLRMRLRQSIEEDIYEDIETQKDLFHDLLFCSLSYVSFTQLAYDLIDEVMDGEGLDLSEATTLYFLAEEDAKGGDSDEND